MRAEDFVPLVRGSHRSGDGYIAHCPAHGDERPSLSFTDGERGLVLKCHAGCSAQKITAAIGLTLADLFENAGSRVPASASRVVTEYSYTDEFGELLYVVERRFPKTFRQRRPDGIGGWVWSLHGVRRVLYRLPEISAAMSAAPAGAREILIVEGEKDVDRLAGLRLAATTSPGGAGKWRNEYAEQLRAAGVERVIVLPDNDEAGESHAVAASRSCVAAGLQVKIVHLPGLHMKGDVSDWLDAGHSVEELAHLAGVVATFTASEACAPMPGSSVSSATGAVLVCLADVAREEVSWLWPGRLARGKLTLLIGDPGLGKSFTTLDIAARVSRGAGWPDGGAPMVGPVILLTAEDGLADTVRPRLDALGAHVAGVHALRAVRDSAGERHFNLESDLPALEAKVRQTSALLVVVDPLSAYLGGRDSYKDAEIRGVLSPLAALAERHRVALVGVMHLTKDQQRPALYRALGSVGLVAAARIVLAVAKDPDDDGRRVFVTVKNNLSAPAPGLAFRLDDGRLEWEPGVLGGIDADTLLSATSVSEREDRCEADDFLHELLAECEMASSEVLRSAKANGIARATLFRAKKRLGVRARHEGQPGKGGRWYWSLPSAEESHPAGSKSLMAGEVTLFEQARAESDEPAGTSSKSLTFAGMRPFADTSRSTDEAGVLDL